MMEAMSTLLAIRDLFRQQIHGIRRFGAATLDLCFVGQGSFGAFFEYELSPWDFCRREPLFVEEAVRASDNLPRREPLSLKNVEFAGNQSGATSGGIGDCA